MTEFGLTPHNVDRIVTRLKARGLIAEVRGDINGYIPGRAASTIPARRGSVGVPVHGHRAGRGGDVARVAATLVQDLDESRRRRIGGVTIADLMPAPDGKPREEAVPLTIVPPGGTD